MTTIEALLLEDDQAQARAVMETARKAKSADIHLTHVTRLKEAMDVVTTGNFDVALLDLGVPDAKHLEPVWVMRREAPEMPIVVLTDQDEDLGFESVQAGAQDYMVKGHASGPELVRVLRVAMERQRVLNEAMALSFLDTLTGLHNRRGFQTLADHQVRIATRTDRPLIVFFVDLDGLKSINDQLGHQHGDAAIAETAAVLRETFRDTDLLARLGGDEFAVLAIEAPDQTLDTLLGRLSQRLNAHNSDQGRDYSLDMSVGTAHFDPTQPQSIDRLLHQADAAMYEEKLRKHAQRP